MRTNSTYIGGTTSVKGRCLRQTSQNPPDNLRGQDNKVTISKAHYKSPYSKRIISCHTQGTLQAAIPMKHYKPPYLRRITSHHIQYALPVTTPKAHYKSHIHGTMQTTILKVDYKLPHQRHTTRAEETIFKAHHTTIRQLSQN